MTSKSLSWHQKVPHEIKNTSWRRKDRHDVKKCVMTSKTLPWHKTSHDVKNTSKSSSQLIFRKAAQKPPLTAGVTIELIDDQSYLWAVAHYWHGEILANFCWTPPLISEPYLSLWLRYWDTIGGIWKEIDTSIKWYNRCIYKPINPRDIHVAPRRQSSELFVQSYLYRDLSNMCTNDLNLQSVVDAMGNQGFFLGSRGKVGEVCHDIINTSWR